ncbi:hypothetical protein [Thalassovita gelatinovora]|uniref:hypothetical protein n=1 Tax=Thalassovita gelatinovora TaxID=53501 RepID=UPI001FD12B6B|nr:hypothetical protein [Thalassovita gelatinovora]
MDHVDHAPLIFVQLGGFLQQLDHANDAVYRRSDFMAHVGQERRFCLTGIFRLYTFGVVQLFRPLEQHDDHEHDQCDHQCDQQEMKRNRSSVINRLKLRKFGQKFFVDGLFILRCNLFDAFLIRPHLRKLRFGRGKSGAFHQVQVFADILARRHEGRKLIGGRTVTKAKSGIQVISCLIETFVKLTRDCVVVGFNAFVVKQDDLEGQPIRGDRADHLLRLFKLLSTTAIHEGSIANHGSNTDQDDYDISGIPEFGYLLNSILVIIHIHLGNIS